MTDLPAAPPQRAFARALARGLLALGLACAVSNTASAQVDWSTPRPWLDPHLSPDARAAMVLRQLTLDEKISLVYGFYGIPQPKKDFVPPKAAIGSAGYVPGVPRLGVPALQETDAGVGVAWAHGVVADRLTVSLPSGLATAATWNPQTAYRGGAMIGEEASRSGFNVLLAGGVDLVREPRNGRNFEYAGEDPLLAGIMVAAQIRGIQDQHVISTIKHFALNDQETGRMTASADIADRPARESDLLAFQIAIEQSDPGSVMCAYNRVNGVYACENDDLLNGVLKRDWRWPGFVMSDWGAVHSTARAANAGLDQESAAASFDTEVFFGARLKQAVERGEVPQARLDDMVRRILRTMFDKGVVDHPPVRRPLDIAADAAVSQADAEEGAVLLKNARDLLPLARSTRRIAVIGGHADVGVLSGGGSSQVMSPGGNAVPDPSTDFPRPTVYHPSSPLKAIRASAPDAQVRFADGRDLAVAARLAVDSDVAVVFATQWMGEAQDAPDLSLPDRQDALIAAVARANPRTVVVLETGGPVLAPWLGQVGAVLEAWYPGTRGGQAIARLLFGEVSPSGRLPVTFPRSQAQTPRPTLDGVGLPADARFAVRYDEGALVGYKWYDARGREPLFPFGYGLTYSRFRYGKPVARADAAGARIGFSVTNTGARRAKDVPQVYLGLPASLGHGSKRLVGWRKVDLAPGETRQVTVTVDPKLLAAFEQGGWRIHAGDYPVMVGASSRDLATRTVLRLGERRWGPGRW